MFCQCVCTAVKLKTPFVSMIWTCKGCLGHCGSVLIFWETVRDLFDPAARPMRKFELETPRLVSAAVDGAQNGARNWLHVSLLSGQLMFDEGDQSQNSLGLDGPINRSRLFV